MTQYLYQQPTSIPARAGTEFEGLLTALDARIQTHGVPDRPLQASVHVDQKVDDMPSGAVHARQPGHEARALLRQFEIGLQFLTEEGVITEGKVLGVALHIEVEWIDHGHVRDQPHVHAEFRDRLRKDRPRNCVSEGILLPVEAMLGRTEVQVIVPHGRTRMGSRMQSNELG